MGEPETIVASAVRVLATAYGKGHHVCFGKLARKDAKYEQGFITSAGRYVDRVEALRIATEAGQLIAKHRPEDLLMSEDLWGGLEEALGPKPVQA